MSEALKRNYRVKLNRPLNPLERQGMSEGNSLEPESGNPDAAIYKLNRPRANFVSSLRLSLLIYQMVITNLYVFQG